jgi:hypothetical protein
VVKDWAVDPGYQAYKSSARGPQGEKEISREKLADPIVPQEGPVRVATVEIRWSLLQLVVAKMKLSRSA